MLENYFANQSPENSIGRIKLAPGQRNGKKTLIMELVCESNFEDNSATNTGFISNWFDKAHSRLRAQFEAIATDQLRAIMGERKEIG